jgi:ribosomal protein S18 acetylase RimI-like enzyme
MAERTPLDVAKVEVRELTSRDSSRVATVACGDADLDEFLRDDALRLQEMHVARTYLGLYDGAFVGYVTLMVDAIVLVTGERKRLGLVSADHPVVPALKIARLAVSESFRAAHRGTGELLARFAVAVAYSLGQQAGCRLLTVDAYPTSVAFYERLGFAPNRAKEYRGRGHPSMRFDLYAPKLPAWVGP